MLVSLPRTLRIYVALAWMGVALSSLAIAVWLGKFCWHFVLFSKLVGIRCACGVCPFVNEKWWVILVVVCALAVHVFWTRLTIRRICDGNKNLLIAEWIAAVPILACSICICSDIPSGIAGRIMVVLSPLAIFPCENLLSILTLVGRSTRAWVTAHGKKCKVGRIVAWFLGIIAARSVFLFSVLLILLVVHSIRGCSEKRCDIMAAAINFEVPNLVPNLASTLCENASWVKSRTNLDKDLLAELDHNKELLSRWAGSNDFGEGDQRKLRTLFENIYEKHPRSGFDVCLAEILCELCERKQSNKELLEHIGKEVEKMDEKGSLLALDDLKFQQELLRAESIDDDALLSERSHSLCQDIVNDMRIDNRLRVLAMRQLARMNEEAGKIDDAIKWHLRIRGLSFDDMKSARALHDLTIEPWRAGFVQ